MKESTRKELEFRFLGFDIKIDAFYKLLYQINDIMLALFFIIGSFLFFSESTTFYGTVLFVIGSFELLIRPIITITRDIHIYKIKQNKNL
ncbi:YrhK family protein [Staphylococcus equorum]|uniref:YrhK family protein n=1 Tax=Staphylococcus equorum TaxID=246432 RepID=UPI00203DB566|nr:YrhK family protein [Staphylococcus equorum]MCM3073621.1 YrhK family protein [Staphylococcus equorum]